MLARCFLPGHHALAQLVRCFDQCLDVLVSVENARFGGYAGQQLVVEFAGLAARPLQVAGHLVQAQHHGPVALDLP